MTERTKNRKFPNKDAKTGEIVKIEPFTQQNVFSDIYLNCRIHLLKMKIQFCQFQ